MKISKYVVLGLFGILPHAGIAGPLMFDAHGMGNGGDAVVCYTNSQRESITSIKFFDYWEQAQTLKLGKVSLGDPNLPVKEKLEITIDRIKRFDPNLADQISKIAFSLADNISGYLVSGYILPEIDDATPEVVPAEPNCFIEQFAIQFRDVSTGQRRFYISEKFYNHSSITNDERAGLLLHEAFYRIAILRNNAENSDGVRAMNYVASTEFLEKISQRDLKTYLGLLDKYGLSDSRCINEHGFYIDKSGWEYKTCYNQLHVAGNIEVYATAGTSFHATGPSYQRLSLSPNSHQIKRLSVKLRGTSEVDVSSDSVGFGLRTISIQDIRATKPGVNIVLRGLKNYQFACGSAELNFKTLEVVVCDNIWNSLDFRYVRSVSPGIWEIAKLTNGARDKLPVLGSKVGLTVRPLEDNSKNIFVNANMEMISGKTEHSWILIKGFRIAIDQLEVLSTSSGYVLSFVSSRMSFPNPKYRGLRVISEDLKLGGTKFCNGEGYDKGIATIRGSEYIGLKGEQFFDISTEKIVFKTDEEVQVVQTVDCSPQFFQTSDY